MKIKFNSDDDLSLKKTRALYNIAYNKLLDQFFITAANIIRR